MREMTVSVFKFDELSDKAKEKARDWYRSGALQDDWWDSVYDDATAIADKLGIDLKTRVVKLYGGGTRMEPNIWFSGFCSQGDGACFEGTYHYRKHSVQDVKEYAPKDVELHKIAEGLYDIQRRHFYGIFARIEHTGHYYHSYSTRIECFGNGDGDDCDNAVTEQVAEYLRDFMDWIYSALEREHDYLLSEECVDESITANEYEFDEDGKLV